jgi:hypothetical protein
MKSKIYTIIAAVALLFTSCENEETSMRNIESAISSGGVTPTLINGFNNGGNVTCQEAATNAGLSGYEFSTGRIDYNNGTFSSNFGIFTVTTDGVNVSWTVNPPAGFCVSNVAVIVKGGRGANVYYYNNGETSDSGLVSPVNASGSPAGLSNLTICYNLTPCAVVCNWQEETAFGGAIRGEGNAWWYAIDASTSGTYPIYAGQNAVAGASVNYNATTDVITINLGNNMQLQNVSESVKAQGYNVLPSTRPAAGLFTLYKGTGLTIQGNGSNYYVVHLDVEVCN